MDKPFPPTAWKPSEEPESWKADLTPSDLITAVQRLNRHTEMIYRYPYEPHAWLDRAKTLVRLRYPELAVGDAHKASLLAEEHLQRLTGLTLKSVVGGEGGDDVESAKTEPEWRLGHRMGFWMLTDPEVDGPRDEELYEMLVAHLRRLQQKAGNLVQEHLTFAPLQDEGAYRRRPYPWMQDVHLRRSDAVVDQLNADFDTNARDVLRKRAGPVCEVQRHAFGRHASRDTSDILGVFAMQDFAANEHVLIDTTRTWGCNGPGSNGDLEEIFDGEDQPCYDPIHPNEDSDTMTLDLRWIRDLVGTESSYAQLLVRLLLCCIRDGVEMPLDHPLCARLTPTYSESLPANFNYNLDMVIPNAALGQIGIDIFANPNFDTWVLLTMQARVSNNCCSDPMSCSVYPLFSLFNHSCEANLRWHVKDDHRTIVVRTLRHIKKGEQLFVDYDGFGNENALKARREGLWRWLDSPCACSRCTREEAEEARRVSKMAHDVDEMEEKLQNDLDNKKNNWAIPESELPLL